jgi:O-antigen ligase
LLFGFPFALHLLHNTRISISIRSVLVVGIAASAVALACTYHRTGLIAVGFEVVLWYVLTGKVRASNLKHLAYTVPFLLLAAPVAVAWISMLFNRSVASGGGADEFLRGRGLNWLLFLGTLFHSQPLYWFLGKGSSLAEAFVPGYGMYYSDEPHNDVIRMLYIYGIVGLCIYATILYRFFRQSLVLRRGADPFGRSLGNLSLAILPSFLLMSMTGEPLRYPTGAWYLFAMASIVRVQSQKVSFAASGPQC